MAIKIFSNRFGWVPDLPDHRDHVYAAPQKVVSQLPPTADLRRQCPAIYNQGNISSCTANAIGAAVQFTRRKEKHRPDFAPSRLFIYWNERNMEHTVPIDCGAQIRNGIKVVNKLGVCPETAWSYDDTPSDPKTYLWPAGAKPTVQPPKECFAAAVNYQAIAYQRVDRSLSQMKGCLASGYPFVFGFTVYESFQSAAVAKTGVLPMPLPNEKMDGGHAVLAVGYNDAKQVFIVRNSWGADWGQKGHFHHSLRVPARLQSVGRLLDDSRRGVSGSAG